MSAQTPFESTVIDPYEFTGFHGCRCICRLEILRLQDGRAVVIAIEREDNPGTSVTNAFEILAASVCEQFGIDPQTLVWIEHYGYASAIDAGNPRTYDLVSFTVRTIQGRRTAREPQWRPMQEADWWALGIEARQAVEYQRRFRY